MLQGKVVENVGTQFIFNNVLSKSVPFVINCGKNIIELSRPQIIIRRTRVAYRKLKFTNSQFIKFYFTYSMLNMCFSLPHGYHPNQPHRNSNTHRNKNTQPMW